MVLLFSGSTEFRTRSADRVAAIEIRHGMLRTVGPTSEVDAAEAVVAAGTAADLVAAILASPAYAARVLAP